MNVKWFVEHDVFSENTEAMISALKNQGLEYNETSNSAWNLCVEDSFLDLYDDEDCVVFRGSLQLAKSIKRKSKWIPGVYYNTPKYNCVDYYSALGEYLLNSNYIMLPFSELLRRKDDLYNYLGSNDTVFIRPNRGDKLFTGKVVYKEEYEKDIKLFGFYDVDPEEIVIVAEPQNIVCEWRFVVVDSKVITGSQYNKNRRHEPAKGYSTEAFELAGEIAVNYNPDIAWVVDIGETSSGEFKMVEIGCFSCACLYEADYEAVVESVSKAALAEWKDYRD